MIYLLLFTHSIIAGILYRLGGAKGFNTKFRDFGIPLIILDLFWILGYKINWLLIFSLILTFIALTTYWDKLTKIWRHDESEYFENWFLHGFFIGLSLLPLTSIFGYLIVIRAIVLGLLMAIWSNIINNDFWEEFGRGFLIIVTLKIII